MEQAGGPHFHADGYRPLIQIERGGMEVDPAVGECRSQADQGAGRRLQIPGEVFGPEAGMGARSAIGTNGLPLGVPIEIEAIFEIE